MRVCGCRALNPLAHNRIEKTADTHQRRAIIVLFYMLCLLNERRQKSDTAQVWTWSFRNCVGRRCRRIRKRTHRVYELSPRLFIIFLQYLMARITRFLFDCEKKKYDFCVGLLCVGLLVCPLSELLVSIPMRLSAISRTSVQLPTYCNQFECLRIQLFGWLSAWILWPAVSFAVRPSQMICHVHIMLHWTHCYVLCSQNHQPDEESRQTLCACILSNDKSEEMRVS